MTARRQFLYRLLYMIAERTGSSPSPHARRIGESFKKDAPTSLTGLSQLTNGSASALPAPAAVSAASQLHTRINFVPTAATIFPLDEKSTWRTGSAWLSVARAWPEPRSHNLTVSSSDPDAATSDLSPTATSFTGALWPSMSRTQPEDAMSHKRRVQSCEPDRA
eukprot:scaffold245460_cov32-Tisochrysis_lutea.AAC.2